MIEQRLPYIIIDDEFSLNFSILIIIIKRLGLSSKKNAVLGFDKLQIFLYLTKNPSKINSILALAGKEFTPISVQYTYTIESLSSNVDMLFNRNKLKVLLQEAAARGLLRCELDNRTGSPKYLLSEKGELFFDQLCGQFVAQYNTYTEPLNSFSKNYFQPFIDVVDSLSSLQSHDNSKLNSYLNSIFKRS